MAKKAKAKVKVKKPASVKNTKKTEPTQVTTKPPRIRLSKDQQHYLVNGVKFARMTRVISVLDDGFERAKAAIGEAKMAEYADHGTRVHTITELDDRNKHKAVNAMLAEHPDLAIILASWRVWVEEMVKEFIAIEVPVWSEKYECAGTVDRIAILKGDHRPSIVDIKTSSSVHESAFVQMAGYKLLYNEMVKGRNKAVRTVAVWMPRPSAGDLGVKERTAKKYEEKFLRAVKEHKQLMGQ